MKLPDPKSTKSAIKRIFSASLSVFAIIGLGFPPLQSAAALQTPGAKQIVLIMGDVDKEFVSVSIQGYNQYNQWETWTLQDPLGFSLAYTKDWWWSQNFVQISFTVRDGYGFETSQLCLIDALEQPASSPRVEILYTSLDGCVGGESGNTQDLVMTTMKPIRDAFATIDYYFSDFDVDVFIKTLYIEANAAGCAVAVGTALQSGGLSYAVATPFITKMCWTTSDQILKLFIKP